jgi:ADP-heptose:LPS heptosyltransferase
MNQWLLATFGVTAPAYIAPRTERISGNGRHAAISLGVGENEAKRIGGDFESKLISALGIYYENLWVDRGAGGDEARRVTAAVEESGVGDRVRFWEGSFAGFASIISQCDFYSGYESAGQHAAAAAGVSTVSIFAGAPSERFFRRWSPAGHRKIVKIAADGRAPDEVLNEFVTWIAVD